MPYRPNPLKYKYLLQNKYETVSNLVNSTGANDSGGESPLLASATKKNVQGSMGAQKLLGGSYTVTKINKEFLNF